MVRPLFLLLFLSAITVQAQPPAVCSCGANPSGPPHNRELHPYAKAPEDMRPYSSFAAPYYENYGKLVEYNGAARDAATVKPEQIDEVRIGFLGPIEDHPNRNLGLAMLHGAQLAIDEANAARGYGGKPFKLMVHNDQAVWGASSNEIVKMAYDEKVWAMLGSISADSTHIALRVTLKAEVPIVNSASTDPTIPETIIPWYFTTIQDDRVQSYTLARRIYTDLGLQRVALLRANDRYGRFGVLKFKDASRRLGHPVVIEQKYMLGDADFRRALRIIGESGADAVVIWGDAAPAGGILKQMREMGMKQRVFGSFRVLGDDMLRIAGSAAEGLEIVYPFDPTRDDPAWVAFQHRYQAHYGAPPEAFASLAYDTMSILLRAICEAGLNRGRIRDALTGLEHYKGVTGEMTFDPNCKNIVPMYLATVRSSKYEFRRYPMDAPYAKVGEAYYNGPPVADLPPGPVRIGIFGPNADREVETVSKLLVPYAGRYALTAVPSDVPWGRASTGLVKLIYDDRALVLIALDRNSSHLAEQLAAKAFVPVVAISADRSLTSVNIPWLFRMPPETGLADALRMVIGAAERSGGNRQQLRSILASTYWSGLPPTAR
ncbi:MAG TPA: ABC transporter substrate-binding protein [Verrucomicrobiae bacterium]|nr:ABC transporter substrate-binding protein [Verrucomicrobiae bacterium]